MTTLVLRFLRDEFGRGVGEALLVTGTSLLIIPSTHDVGARLVTVFETLARALR